MIENLEEISANNGISLEFLQQGLSLLESQGRKSIRFQGKMYEGIVIETIDILNEEYSTLILKYNSYDDSNKLMDFIKQFDFNQKYFAFKIEDQQEYPLIICDLPLYTTTLSEVLSKQTHKSYLRNDIVSIFTKLSYVIAFMQESNAFTAFNPESIFFRKDGSLFLNQLKFVDLKTPSSFEEHQKYMPSETIEMYTKQEDLTYDNSVNVYTVGMMFLQILGLELDNKMAEEIRKENYDILKDLPHSDLVSLITEMMICKKEDRKKLIEIHYLLRFRFTNQNDNENENDNNDDNDYNEDEHDDLTTFEKCQFIQSQMHINNDEIEEFIKNNQVGHQARILKEFKNLFSNLNQLSNFNQNGCIVKSIGENRYVFNVVGQQGSLYEDYLLEAVLEVSQEYPYKPPFAKVISGISTHPAVGQDKSLMIDILKNNWSPPLTFFTTIISIASVLNCEINSLTEFCEYNPDIKDKQLQTEEDFENLTKFQDYYQSYKSLFLSQIFIYSDNDLVISLF